MDAFVNVIRKNSKYELKEMIRWIDIRDYLIYISIENRL